MNTHMNTHSQTKKHCRYKFDYPPPTEPEPAVSPGAHVTAGQLLISENISQPFSHIIRDPLGIHARPAGKLVSLIKGLDCKVTIQCGNKTADAGSILELMSLGAAKDDELHISAEGPDAHTALAELKRYMNEKM